jgi:hypothetical protein
MIKYLNALLSKLGHLECDIKEIPSLKVSVAVCKATLPDAEDHSGFIAYGDFELLGAPTRGRLSGLDPDNEAI